MADQHYHQTTDEITEPGNTLSRENTSRRGVMGKMVRRLYNIEAKSVMINEKMG